MKKFYAFVIVQCVIHMEIYDTRDEAVNYLREKYEAIIPVKSKGMFNEIIKEKNTFYIYGDGISFCFQIIEK